MRCLTRTTKGNIIMPVTDLLERNHKLYGDEVALVELNPTMTDPRRTTWKEYDLVQQTNAQP